MERITVVKIGGNVIDSPEATARFVEAFAALEGPKMLVHGGGKLATRLAAQLGIESRMVDGRRITDRETLDVVTMVYAGLINKRLVAALSAAGCRAIGLSGADGDAVTSVRRAAGAVDYGYVGDIAEGGVNVELLRTLLDAGLTPIFSAITCDGRGTLLNTNADSVASAAALGVERFVSPTTSDMALMAFPSLKMGAGDSARSHTADEYVLRSEVEQGVEGYIRYIAELAKRY